MDQGRLSALVERTERFLKEARAGQRLLAAVSGGADSVCLLLCACALREKGYQVTAAHVRHDLRDTAAGDEAFVRSLCGQLGVPFRTVSVHVPRNGSTEEQARIARYQALFGIFRETGADALLLAHHQNDQAETVLMRLIRGCGAEGLSAMKERTFAGNVLLLRPFLSVSGQAIRSALREAGQTWCEDETNQDTRYTRNFLRHRILSPLEESFPGSVRGICRSAEILSADNDCMAKLAQEALREAACLEPPCRFLLRRKLESLHPALQRRVIRLFLSACGSQAGFEKTEEIRCALSSPPAGINIGQGASLLFTQERLHFVPALPPDAEVPEGFFSVLPGNGPGDGLTCQALPRETYLGSDIRTARPGDLFQPFGHQKTVRLSRFLIERKIDRPFRAFIPLICRENVVLWIPGVAASELLRHSGEPSVLLGVQGRLPWQMTQEPKQEETANGNHSAHL